MVLLFLYNLYIFVSIQHSCLADTVSAFHSSGSVIKRLLCIFESVPLSSCNIRVFDNSACSQ